MNFNTVIAIFVTSALSWLGSYVLNAPKESATALESVKTELQLTKSDVRVLQSDSTTIKADILEIKSDVKELLRNQYHTVDANKVALPPVTTKP